MQKDFKIHLIVGIEEDNRLLPQFLAHYHKLGVDQFLINLIDTRGDGSILQSCKQMLAPYKHVFANVHIGKHRWTKQIALMKIAQEEYAAPTDWVLTPDLDELHEYSKPLREVLTQADTSGYNVITGEFLDRITESGELIELNTQMPLSQQFPLGCQMSVVVQQVPRVRTVAVRGDVFIGKNFDTDGDPEMIKGQVEGRVRLHPTEKVVIHHYKWHSRVLKNCAQRLAHYKALYDAGQRAFGHFGESERLVQYLAANRQRINPWDKNLETRIVETAVTEETRKKLA